MSIRINLLARELEVKAHAILDKLPDFGVTEKKTHSSSVDADVAEKLRLFFLSGSASAESFEPRTARAATPETDHSAEQHQSTKTRGIPQSGSVPGATSLNASDLGRASMSSVATLEAPVATAEHDSPGTAKGSTAVLEPPPVEEKASARTSPLRPPMGNRSTTPAVHPQTSDPASRAAGPSAPGSPAAHPLASAPATLQTSPLRPPVGALRPIGTTPSTTQTVSPASAAPSAPAQRPSPSTTALGRPTPIPARPLPTAPQPGQVISGPRAPFPGSAAPPPVRPATFAPGRPATPAPARTAFGPRSVGGPATGAPPAPQSVTPGAPIAPQRPPVQQRPGLVGQPAPRPIVPPRPDLVNKLRSAPTSPGAPLRPPGPLTPGKPIFDSSRRPGPGTAAPGRPLNRGTAIPGAPRTGMGPRPMHPTSRGGGGALLAPGALPPMPDQARRPGGPRPIGRPQRTRREIEEERTLRPVRRDEPQGPPPINREIMISEGVTVKELSEKLDIKASLIIKKLFDRGIFATINQTLDVPLATEIARAFGASTSTMTFEEEAMFDIEIAEESKDLLPRAPVVTIMGHVDHGKTSLLDTIRSANVAGREAGGITQHIGAYQVTKNERKIVFIDTPGHEAFTRMRSRGAKVTDIVILVVAADDGVMPQTLEAIDHARAAKVPIIVAINKIDRPDAQPDRIKQQLSDRGLLAEDWGGDVVMVPVSAKTGENLDTLLEMILLVADMQNLKCNPARPGMGAVLEAKLDRGRGPVATLLVRNGTVRVGDFFICGQVFGKVRAMFDDLGEPIKEAGPATPVELLGLEFMPEAGDDFQVVTDTAKAKQIVMYREAKSRETFLAKNKRMSLEQLHKQLEAGEVKELPIILKADVGGSAEVLAESLQKLSNEKVRIRVIHRGVGAISESDVLLAAASNAIIIGFNVRPERTASALAEQEKVDVRLHTIIYNLTDEIKRAMIGLLEPVFKELPKGKAEVRDVFRITKVGQVAGCFVTEGTINRDCLTRLIRDNIVVHTGKIGSLRRFKDDVSEVRNGQECGITIANYNDVKQGDIIEAFVNEKVEQTL